MIITGTRGNSFNIPYEEYLAFYEKHDGFNREANRNTRDNDKDLGALMVEGGEALLERNARLVDMLWTNA